MKVNGNLSFHTLGDGELQNAIMERIAGGVGGVSLPATAIAGRLAYNQTDNLYYFHNGTGWVAIATGGNAAALQDEVDAIETTIGDMIGSDGTANTANMNALTNVTGAADLSDVLTQLDAAIEGADELSELDDVTITAADDKDILQYNGTAWVDVTPADLAGDMNLGELADVTDAGALGAVIYKDSASTWAAAGPGAVSGVQAHGDVLDDFNVLTAASAADQFIYSTAAGVFAYGTMTQAGRDLMDDADVAAQRATLDVYQIATADSTFVDVAGDTMTGALSMGGNLITNVADPVAGTDAANKNYVDATAAGLSWKNSVAAATTGNIDLTLASPATIDGVAISDGDRILVQNQTDASENGIYIASTSGAFVRATDFDALTPTDEVNGAAVYVEEGATYGDAGFTVTSQVATLDTDDIIFTQFNGASSITAGVGLEKSGNELFVNMGAGIVALPSDEVGIDLYNSSTGALILTSDGSTRGTATGDQLHLLLDGSTLVQSATGLKVPAAGITSTELSTAVAGLGLQGGGGSALDVRVDDSTIEITSDVLNVKDAGITNAKLTNSTVTMAADSGVADPVSLGETLTFTGGTNIDTVVGANTLTFNWTAAIDDLSDVDTTTAAPAADNVLMWDGSNWVPTDVSAVLDQASIADLADVSAVGSEEGHVLAWDNTNSEFDPVRLHFVHDGSVAALSHTVTHGLNQQYCQVTVCDASDQVIIPDSITFTSTTALTVTFNTSIACKVIVTGVKTA